MDKFYGYVGDFMDLPTNENHMVFRWNEPGCKVLFSVARLGNACSCHFASDKAGLRRLKEAINEFSLFCFLSFDWCTMIIAKVKQESVGRLIKKCGFKEVLTAKGHTAYARCQ